MFETAALIFAIVAILLASSATEAANFRSKLVVKVLPLFAAFALLLVLAPRIG